jgi:hypothetical protein
MEGRRLSLAAVCHIARTRILRKSPRDLKAFAEETWEIAPAETAVAQRAICLDGQLDRVVGWEFASEHPRREMEGGPVAHDATRGYLLRDVWLLDGALFKRDGYHWLTPRADRLPQVGADGGIERAALFCTAMGNRYFGQWLMDDCATYPLADAEGVPVTTDQPCWEHTAVYEDWLGMRPERLHNAFFRELVIFEDFGQNRHKHMRFKEMGRKLRSRVRSADHPGVFILRGKTGELRLLRNEMEIAERLRDERGFRILDPASCDVPTIVEACAGARMVVGVEGSGLIHGILQLGEGGGILTLQPPNRFVSVYKHLADRDGQSFGFVVGVPEESGFRVDPDEVERTIDLFPASARL